MKLKDVAIVRLEQIYTFPDEMLAKVLKRYKNATEIVWCQEEPKNQGAWYQIRHHLQACQDDKQSLLYAGREISASPAVGKFSVHQQQQDALVETALTTGGGDKL